MNKLMQEVLKKVESGKVLDSRDQRIARILANKGLVEWVPLTEKEVSDADVFQVFCKLDASIVLTEKEAQILELLREIDGIPPELVGRAMNLGN